MEVPSSLVQGLRDLAAGNPPKPTLQPSSTLPHPPITSITPEAASISSTSPTVTSTLPGAHTPPEDPPMTPQPPTNPNTTSPNITSISPEPHAASSASNSGSIPVVTSIAAGDGGGEGPSGREVSFGGAREKENASGGRAQPAAESTSGELPADITGLLSLACLTAQ